MVDHIYHGTIYQVKCLHNTTLLKPSLAKIWPKISRTQSISPKPKDKTTRKRERDLGRNLVPWQEEVVGNDPTGRNPRRAAGDGDLARASGAVLERERGRETNWGERRMGMGELELPLPVFNPHTPSTAW